MLKEREINGVPCSIKEHSYFNHAKGLIYVKDLDTNSEESLKNGLKSRYDIKEVLQAHWIKQKDQNSKPFLITFDQPIIAQSLKILGQGNLNVYEYRPRPLFCSKCLEYSHSKKNCQNQYRCSRCTNLHIEDNCSNSVKCLHCSGEHKTADKLCPKQKEQEKITKIQYEEKISWNMARQQYNREATNNNNNNSYAAALRNNASRPNNELETVIIRKGPSAETSGDGPVTVDDGVTTMEAAESSRQKQLTHSDVVEDLATKRKTRHEHSDEEEESSRRKEKRALTEELPDYVEASAAETSVDSEMDSSETNEKLRREAKKMFREFSNTVNREVTLLPDQCASNTPSLPEDA